MSSHLLVPLTPIPSTSSFPPTPYCFVPLLSFVSHFIPSFASSPYPSCFHPPYPLIFFSPLPCPLHPLASLSLHPTLSSLPFGSPHPSYHPSPVDCSSLVLSSSCLLFHLIPSRSSIPSYPHPFSPFFPHCPCLSSLCFLILMIPYPLIFLVFLTLDPQPLALPIPFPHLFVLYHLIPHLHCSQALTSSFCLSLVCHSFFPHYALSPHPFASYPPASSSSSSLIPHLSCYLTPFFLIIPCPLIPLATSSPCSPCPIIPSFPMSPCLYHLPHVQYQHCPLYLSFTILIYILEDDWLRDTYFQSSSSSNPSVVNKAYLSTY